jgi:hypothetical protein
VFFGYALEKRADVGVKVVRRTSPDERNPRAKILIQAARMIRSQMILTRPGKRLHPAIMGS